VSEDPAVTVVVMTRDRGPRLLETLHRHEGPVIVVDNGSTDGTPELVRRRFPSASVVELGRNLGAVARNVGVEQATTPYVAFADDDSWWAPGALGTASEVMAGHPNLAVLAARTLVGTEEHLDPVSEAMRDSPLGRQPGLPGPSVLGFLACATVVRRTAFLDVGGFDDLLHFMGEEELLALDLASRGWALCYVDQVVAHHCPDVVGERPGRRRRAARNRVLTAAMRRPWTAVARATAAELRRGPAERSGVLDAARSLPEAMRRRSVVPSSVERRRRLLVDG
jgi:glycosyltransferase involved in cell wall biosynthesis